MSVWQRIAHWLRTHGLERTPDEVRRVLSQNSLCPDDDLPLEEIEQASETLLAIFDHSRTIPEEE